MCVQKIFRLINIILRSKTVWGTVIIPLLTLSVYTAFLNEESIWHDEWCTVNVIEQPSFSSFFHEMIRTENNPPLYYILLRLWTLNGKYITTAHIRLLSSLFAVLTIILIFILGKRMFSDSIALAAAFLTALSPFMFWYAQEARNMTLTAFISLLCMTLFYSYAVSGGKRIKFITAVCVMVIGVYTHYFSFFLMPAQLLYCFYLDRKKLFAQWFTGLIFVCLVFCFWIPGLSAQIKDFHSDWLGLPKFDLIWRILKNFSAGIIQDNKNQALIITILYGVLFVFGLTGFPHWIRKRQTQKKISYQTMFLLIFLFVPILIPVAASFFKPIIFQGRRYLIYVLPVFYLIIANGIYSLRNKKIIITLLVFIFCLNTVSLFDLVSVRQKRQWRNVAHVISKFGRTGDAVFSVDYTNGKILTYYGIGNARLCMIPDITSCENELKFYNRLWFVTFIPNCPYKKVFDKKFPLIREETAHSYGGMIIKVALYELKNINR